MDAGNMGRSGLSYALREAWPRSALENHQVLWPAFRPNYDRIHRGHYRNARTPLADRDGPPEERIMDQGRQCHELQDYFRPARGHNGHRQYREQK